VKYAFGGSCSARFARIQRPIREAEGLWMPALLSVLSVESLSLFWIVNCQSVGLLCPEGSGLCVLC
jgi:hypothetical protein